MNSFTGDNKKFYPERYKIHGQAKDLQNLDHNCCMILRFEVANHDVLSFDEARSERLTEKGISIICQVILLGHFTGEFAFENYQQCLSFLMAGKCGGESIPIVLRQHRYV